MKILILTVLFMMTNNLSAKDYINIIERQARIMEEQNKKPAITLDQKIFEMFKFVFPLNGSVSFTFVWPQPDLGAFGPVNAFFQFTNIQFSSGILKRLKYNLAHCRYNFPDDRYYCSTRITINGQYYSPMMSNFPVFGTPPYFYLMIGQGEIELNIPIKFNDQIGIEILGIGGVTYNGFIHLEGWYYP